MVSNEYTVINPSQQLHVKKATSAAFMSLLNLTFLPGLAFIWLLITIQKTPKDTLEHYHCQLAIKLNIVAGICLVLVTALMIFFGGFYSAWTWVYVITYFTFIHTSFIVISLWTLTRAWSGLKLRT